MSVERYTVKTNCKFCGSLIDSFGLNKVCPDCSENLENYFKSIREYLENNPDTSGAAISEALNIPLPVITYFIKEDRLMQKVKDSAFAIRCKSCGKPIHHGQYCMDCSVASLREEIYSRKTKSEPPVDIPIPLKSVPEFHTHKKKRPD